MAMTAEPFYRWLSQQPHWQPPSDNYAVRYNRNPTAAQDLRNLFGNFFAQNYAPQYQQHRPYQATPFQTPYNPYSTSNVSPAQQEINQRIGDALHSYTPPQPQPSPSPYQTTMPLGYNPAQPVPQPPGRFKSGGTIWLGF